MQSVLYGPNSDLCNTSNLEDIAAHIVVLAPLWPGISTVTIFLITFLNNCFNLIWCFVRILAIVSMLTLWIISNVMLSNNILSEIGLSFITLVAQVRRNGNCPLLHVLKSFFQYDTFIWVVVMHITLTSYIKLYPSQYFYCICLVLFTCMQLLWSTVLICLWLFPHPPSMTPLHNMAGQLNLWSLTAPTLQTPSYALFNSLQNIRFNNSGSHLVDEWKLRSVSKTAFSACERTVCHAPINLVWVLY